MGYDFWMAVGAFSVGYVVGGLALVLVSYLRWRMQLEMMRDRLIPDGEQPISFWWRSSVKRRERDWLS